MHKTIIALLSLSGYSFLSAATITLTGIGSYAPGPTATYQETLTYNPPSFPFPFFEEKSTCSSTSLLGFGPLNCSLGSFSLQFPQIVIPAGHMIQSAQITVNVRGQWESSLLHLVSVIPIDPSKPYSAGFPGNHFVNWTTTCSIFGCSDTQRQADSLGIGPGIFYSADFSNTAINALALNNGTLSPITGQFDLQFGFMTGLSLATPINAVSVFQDTFLVPTATVTAALVITTAATATPEPSAFVLCCIAGMSFIGLTRRRKLA